MSTALAVDSHLGAVVSCRGAVDCSVESYINNFLAPDLCASAESEDQLFTSDKNSESDKLKSEEVKVEVLCMNTSDVKENQVDNLEQKEVLLGEKSFPESIVEIVSLADSDSLSDDLAEGSMNVSSMSSGISPERRSIRKNLKPIKNRGAKRVLASQELLAVSSSEQSAKGTASLEARRGVRLRKPSRFGKYLESDIDDDTIKSKRFKARTNSMPVRKKLKTISKQNSLDEENDGKIKPVNENTSKKSPHKANDSIKTSTESPKKSSPVNGAYNNDKTESEMHKSNKSTSNITRSASKSPPAKSNGLKSHILKSQSLSDVSASQKSSSPSKSSSALPSTPKLRERGTSGSPASRNGGSDKKSRKSRKQCGQGDEAQPGTCLQLSVANEAGEMEDVMVTIVDIDSCSDDESGQDDIQSEETSVTNNSEPKIKASPSASHPTNNCSRDKEGGGDMIQKNMIKVMEAEDNKEIEMIRLSEDDKSVLSSVGELSKIPKCSSTQRRSVNSATKRRPKSEATPGSTCRTSSIGGKRKRKAAYDDDEDYNENSKMAKRLKDRYGNKSVRPGKGRPSGKSLKLKGGGDCNAPDIGPCIKIIGSKSSPVSCKLLNSRQEDSESKRNERKTLPNESFCFPAGKKFVASSPWVCVFCNHGSTYRNLGDLYGPYYTVQRLSDNMSLSENLKTSSAIKPESSDAVIRRRKSRNDLKKSASPSKEILPQSRELSTELPEEMWLHMECTLWTNGVHAAGGRLRGVEEAASIARKTVCCTCGKLGATLGCYMKGCSLTYHYICAVETGCVLEEENFTMLCSKHKDKGKLLRPDLPS